MLYLLPVLLVITQPYPSTVPQDRCVHATFITIAPLPDPHQRARVPHFLHPVRHRNALLRNFHFTFAPPPVAITTPSLSHVPSLPHPSPSSPPSLLSCPPFSLHTPVLSHPPPVLKHPPLLSQPSFHSRTVRSVTDEYSFASHSMRYQSCV